MNCLNEPAQEIGFSRLDDGFQGVNIIPVQSHTSCPTTFKLDYSPVILQLRHNETIGYLNFPGKPRWFMKLNPKGEVPVLVVNDNSVIGSEETIDHLMQGALNPHEYRHISSQWRTIINERLRPAGKKAVLSGGSSADRANLANALEDLDACLAKDSREGEDKVNGNRPFVCGATFTAADVSAFPFLQRVKEEFGFPESCTRLEEWYTSASCRPTVRKTINKNWWWWW